MDKISEKLNLGSSKRRVVESGANSGSCFKCWVVIMCSCSCRSLCFLWMRNRLECLSTCLSCLPSPPLPSTHFFLSAENSAIFRRAQLVCASLLYIPQVHSSSRAFCIIYCSESEGCCLCDKPYSWSLVWGIRGGIEAKFNQGRLSLDYKKKKMLKGIV